MVRIAVRTFRGKAPGKPVQDTQETETEEDVKWREQMRRDRAEEHTASEIEVCVLVPKHIGVVVTILLVCAQKISLARCWVCVLPSS